jgi:DEAD/DEAH box helicase domain-containing protein
MIPSIVARQTRETVLDYLRTTFSLSDREAESALFAFLDSSAGMFRGPYLDVRLPFRKAPQGAPIPLDIAPGFAPYRHQLRAFQRLYTRGGHQPQPTLVTTGTGSGKTECFLFPILDHCWRESGKPGIKAILLYPMNALASDQARRLAETIWDDPRLRGKVSAGLFVGGEGRHGAASRQQLVDKRDILRQSPPDILLTNYRMLDFLLLRPDDQPLWAHNQPDTLRYLVLDELHTYDGAQGSDVACLIRRLKARLGANPHSVCPVGTSATIGGTDQLSGAQALLRFAGQVFGVEFFEDSLVTEDRCSIEEALGKAAATGAGHEDNRIPAPDAALDPTNSESIDDWIQRQIALWMPSLAGKRLDPVALGEQLRRHGFLRQLLRALDKQLREWDQVDTWLGKHEPGWAERTPEDRLRLLESFLGLVSWARNAIPGSARTEPFLTVQVQLWMRELRHLVREVTAKPRFLWEEHLARGRSHHLPIAACRSCGITGWASSVREGESILQTDGRDIGRAWLGRERSCRFLAPAPANGERTGFVLDPRSLRLLPEDQQDRPKEAFPVLVGMDLSDGQPPRFLARCPACDADGAEGLSILGSRAPSLLSVAISHLFQSGYNQDKKLLAFTDSVQDASHRAGFFTARTYRFNLRTAIQGVLEEAGGELPLVGFPERLVDWTTRRPHANANKAVAMLWPGDLVDLGEYQQFRDTGDAAEPSLQQILHARLSWELVLEFGHASRVGRTLEKTGCSSVAWDDAALQKAATLLSLELRESTILEHPIAADAAMVSHFLRGLLLRLRIQGGIDHPFLRHYIESQGAWIHLAKSRQPWLSPFGPHSRLPRLLTDAPPRARQIFQTISADGDRLTWQRDWAMRTLGTARQERGIRALYVEALRRLEEADLLVRHDTTGGNRAWAIAREAIRLTPSVQRLACSTCTATEHVPASEAAAWQDKPCIRYRCKGSWRAVQDDTSYYGRRYRSGQVERIFAHEHTGLLERKEREDLEHDFKSGERADAPNLLVTTPTLEMGVDIGDLSATVLCSVPPSTANYLQRVGRAGRKTGNALCVTVAEAKPHDLYFQADPMLMMRGQVQPPGCFLDAPEMLRRQLIAYAMDCWAKTAPSGEKIPRLSTAVLSDEGGSGFPGSFLRFHKDNHQRIVEDFLRIFGDTISEQNRSRLRDAGGAMHVDAAIRGAFDRIKQEREDLANLLRRTRDRIRKIENDPGEFEDPQAEMRNQESARNLLTRLNAELGQKYPLNVLTDAGILPNYAFPEPGVTLKAVVEEPQQEGGRQRRTSHEYMRPASSALRELAPWNTFYADGRKHTVQELDLGTRQSRLDALWRLCASCSHARMEMPDQQTEVQCPRCQDPRWPDAGQVRRMLRFERSRSMQTALEARTNDDGEDRDRAWYQVETLVDVGPDNYNGAKIIEALPFGIELLKDLVLREINFGQSGGQRTGGEMVAGRTLQTEGFRTCPDCGRVQGPDEPAPRHAPWCRSTDDAPERILLYREVRSEAIRVLLPVAEFGRETRLLSFQAALELGFRRRFSGNPQHLQIRLHDEPIPGNQARRRFLVVFDTVPGGTGYLSELWHGDNFRSILELARSALADCGCQRQSPPAAGCYECVYAYQSQRHLALLSNREAREQLDAVLSRWQDMKPADTLSEAQLDSRLESELEEFFLDALRRHAEAQPGGWQESIHGGERQWRLRVQGREWTLLAQQLLDQGEGVRIPCRPDFVLRPGDGNPAAHPVAVFCDGFRYHAMPEAKEARIHDDVMKRSAILQSGGWKVWNLTWRDVEEFDQGAERPASPPLQAAASKNKLQQLLTKASVPLRAEIAHKPAIALLLEYLAHPLAGDWSAFANAAFLAWLSDSASTPLEQAQDIEDLMCDSASRFGTPMPPAEAARSTWRCRWSTQGSFAALARWDSAQPTRTTSDVKLTLRIFDEAAERSATGFEDAWRSLLATWNLAQFVPSCIVLTSEGRHVPTAAPSKAPAAAAAPTGRLRGLLETLPADVRMCAEQGGTLGLPDPVIGYELMVAEEVAGMAELAWEDLKLAVLVGEQQQDRSTFVDQGWLVCGPDAQELATLIVRRRKEKDQ